MTRQHIYDANGDVIRTVHIHDDGFTLQATQDVSRLIERNKAERELQLDARFITGKRETFTKVASGGVDVLLRMHHEQWDEDDLRRWINDTNNAAYRVWEGRV